MALKRLPGPGEPAAERRAMAGACGEAPCSLLRGLAATALAAGGLGALAAGLAGGLPGQVPPVLALPLCLLGLAVYCYELSGRHIWVVARSFWTGDRFAACAEAMRDAAPLVEFEVPGSQAVPYELVQWRDETVWLDLGFGVQRRLVLASFPLEFIPGDHSEAMALDDAGAGLTELAGGRSPREADAALVPAAAELRLGLRWPDGRETGEPAARLLSSGPGGAEWPCPGLLFLACLCLLGLLADLVLVGLAEPVECPIRKRFFTRESGRMGTLSFSCSSVGVVEVEGNPKELRAANRFWIREEAHWRAVEHEVADLGPDLIRFRWLRRVGQGLAVLLGVTLAGRMVWIPDAMQLGKGPWLLFGSVLVVACLWSLGPLADCLAQRRVQAASEKLGGLLPGGATVTASWVADLGADKGDLSIEVEQPVQKPGAPEELPVLRSSSTLAKSNTASLYYPGTTQWGKAHQPAVHRSQTV